MSLALERHLETTLERLVAENPGSSAADSLLRGFLALRENINPQVVDNEYCDGTARYFEAEHHAVKAIQEKMGLTYSAIMAHQVSLDMARDGNWDGAWRMTCSVYSSWVTRPRWERLLRDTLLCELRTRHHPIPM